MDDDEFLEDTQIQQLLKDDIRLNTLNMNINTDNSSRLNEYLNMDQVRNQLFQPYRPAMVHPPPKKKSKITNCISYLNQLDKDYKNHETPLPTP